MEMSSWLKMLEDMMKTKMEITSRCLLSNLIKNQLLLTKIFQNRLQNHFPDISSI